MQILVADHRPQGDPRRFDPQSLAFDRLQRDPQAQLLGQRGAVQAGSENDMACREGEGWRINCL